MSIKTKFSPLGYLFPKTPQVQLTINCNISVDNIYLNGASIAQNTNTITINVNQGLMCDIYATKEDYNDSLHKQFIIYESEQYDLSLSVSELETLYLTINSGNDGKFIIPFNQYRPVAYNWKVDWGDGTGWHTYSGLGTTNSGITYSNYEANHTYTIRIKNNSIDSGWLQAFGFEPTTMNTDTSPSSLVNKNKVLLVDGQLDSNMFTNNTTLPDYTFAYMFQDCRNLKIGNDFNFPQNITNVGNYICQFMFQNCSSIDDLQNMILSQSLTDVGLNFCYGMFQNCSSLETMGDFNLPQNLVNMNNYTFAYMFQNNTLLTTLNDFNFPQNMLNAPQIGFAYSMFQNCSSLENLGIMKIPNIKSINNNVIDYYNFINNSYKRINDYYNYTTQSIITYFEQTFENCTSLKTGIIDFLSNWTNATQFIIDYHQSINIQRYELISSFNIKYTFNSILTTEYTITLTTKYVINVNSRLFRNMFKNCSLLQENLTSAIKPLSFVPELNITYYNTYNNIATTETRHTFEGCPDAYVSTLNANWK